MGRATADDLNTYIEEEISIHALRGEGDIGRVGIPVAHGLISIHALRGEGDGYLLSLKRESRAFLSTPSVGRATVSGGYGPKTSQL